MKTINAFAVCMRAAGAARALPVASNYAAWPALAAGTAHAQAAAAAMAHAPAATAQRKRRTASTAFVDGGSL
jgi:hypothetical protein